MEQSKSFSLQPLPSNLLPNENFEAWLDNDGFLPVDNTDENNRHYLEELRRVKANFRDGISNRLVITNFDGEILSPIEVYNLIEGYRIRIQKLRLVINPEYIIASHLHNITTNGGSKKVRYLLARAYWISEEGKKVRKFSKNLGAEEKILVNGAVPHDVMDAIEAELVQMSWEQYKSEYPLMVFEPNFTELEFKTLIDKIDLYKEEDYDCTTENVWSYRKSDDIRDGINIKFGNMCSGYPFEITGIPFAHSEGAYIAGAYSSNDPETERVQRLVALEKNGPQCKRVYRNRPEFTQYFRKDFHTYNVQWMLYVLWQKCQKNKDFAELVKKMPVDSHIVENTTLHNGKTAKFWGAKNKDLMDEREKITEEIAANHNFKFKKRLHNAQMLASNAVNNIGHFKGKNVMGKIIKICSLCLIYGQKPHIDYDLLRSKDLYLLGNRLNF